jgi:ribosome-associated protein
MENRLYIRSDVIIPISEIELRFSRSGGPGGQNVNKVSTKVEARWRLDTSSALTPTRRDQLRSALGDHLDADGALRVVVDESRSQWKNRVLALQRLGDILKEALRPKKARVATRPSRSSKAEKLRHKKLQSVKKKLRAASRRPDME